MNELQGQIAIVTGGGTGIGRAIAVALANEGVKVVISGRRTAPLVETTEFIKTEGGFAYAVQADVSKVDDVERLVSGTIQQLGSVDILVNNAAVPGGGYIHEHDITTWDQVVAVNLRGPFLLCRAVLTTMRQRNRGQIINISSEAGIEYYEGYGAYGVTKHALNALGEFVQKENQAFGIRVNTICPGMVVTEMTEDDPNLIHEKSLFPEDIADFAVWLLKRRGNVKTAGPLLVQTMENPWRT
jgi:NAD(P)-dependent dehydrogenase (short-subunit alcohol dehydrogenase family)